MMQTRAQRLDQLAAERDRLHAKSLAYHALADHIHELSAPVNAYARHWKEVAIALRKDGAILSRKAMDVQVRISDLERARDAAENCRRIDDQLRSGSHVTTVASLYSSEDYAAEIRDAGI